MLEKLKIVREASDVYWKAQNHVFLTDNPGYFQLQHKLYSHLVPAYRTVHRTVPRRIVFRAIRWVNPKRQFKLMNVKTSDYANMHEDELKRHITGLNQYRAEALTISNRYDQMIAMIEMGKTPYRIFWPEDNPMTQEEYLERASRLKDGTVKWEHMIDNQAAALTKELGKRKIALGSIDELWEDDMMPFFKKEGKFGDYSKPLRQIRYGPGDNIQREGGRKAKPATPDDRYRTVSPLEVRPGEGMRGGEESPSEDYERGFEVDPGVFPVVGNAISGRTAYISREDVEADRTVIRGPIFLRDEVNPEIYPVQQWRNQHLDKYLDNEVERFNFAGAEFLAKVRTHPFQPEEGDYTRRRDDPVKDTIQDVESEFSERARLAQEEDQKRRAVDPDTDIEEVKEPFDYNAYIRRRRLFTKKGIKRKEFSELNLDEFSEDELQTIGSKILPSNEHTQWGGLNGNQQRQYLDRLQAKVGTDVVPDEPTQLPPEEQLMGIYREDPEYAGMDEDELRQIVQWEINSGEAIESLDLGDVSVRPEAPPQRKALKASLSGETDDAYKRLNSKTQQREVSRPSPDYIPGDRDSSVGLRSTKTRSSTTPEVVDALNMANTRAAQEGLSLDESRAWKSTVEASKAFDYAIDFDDWLEFYESNMDDINYIKNTAGNFHDKYFSENIRRSAYGGADMPSAEDWIRNERVDLINQIRKDSIAQTSTAESYRHIKNMEEGFDKEEMWGRWHEVLEMPDSDTSKLNNMQQLSMETDGKGVDISEATAMESEVTGEPTPTPEAGASPKAPRQPRQPKQKAPTDIGKPKVARTPVASEKRAAYAMKLANGVKVVPMTANEWEAKAEVHADTISRIFGFNNATSYKEVLRLADGTTGMGAAVPNSKVVPMSKKTPEDLNNIFSKDSSRKALYEMAFASFAFSRHSPITPADIAFADDSMFMPSSKGFNGGEMDTMFSPQSAIPNVGIELNPEDYRAEIKQFVDETLPNITNKMAGIMQDSNLGFSSGIKDPEELKNHLFDRAMKSISGNTDNESISYYYPRAGDGVSDTAPEQPQVGETPQAPTQPEAPQVQPEPQAPQAEPEVQQEPTVPTPQAPPAQEEPSDEDLAEVEEPGDDEIDWEQVLADEGQGVVEPEESEAVQGTTSSEPNSRQQTPGEISGGQRAAIVRAMQNYDSDEYDSVYEYIEDLGLGLDDNLMEYIGDYNPRMGDIDDYLDNYEDNPENRFLV